VVGKILILTTVNGKMFMRFIFAIFSNSGQITNLLARKLQYIIHVFIANAEFFK
jgi:hypothetical protein